VFRHYLPSKVTRFLLRKGWIIKPGLETSNPRAAVDRYQQVLEEHGISLTGKRVLDFGYGGHFAVGAELLRRGASHVVLCDPFASSDDQRNRQLLTIYKDFFIEREDRVLPRPEYFTLLERDVRLLAPGEIPPCDLVLSSSVYEHLDDPLAITRALAALTSPDGAHVHFVDLRDHFFKYPFEMLCYSDKVWQRWLNPTFRTLSGEKREFWVSLVYWTLDKSDILLA